MDDDDDMIVIIVGDQNEENQPFAMPIKEEPSDKFDESKLDLESILATAEMHGEYISLTNEEYDAELVKDELDKQGTPKSQVPQLISEIKEDVSEDTPQSDSDDTKHSRTPTKHTQSYIAQLRRNFPKMRKDEEFLVAHLTEMMKQMKAPEPPVGFCQNSSGKLKCSYCETTNETLPSASRHYQKCHGTRFFVCYACGADYRSTTGLYKHEKRCSSPDARLVLLARGRYLGRKGRRRPYLTLNKFDRGNTRNTNTHTRKYRKKRHFCTQCNDSFNQKDALVAHELMHRGIRPYQCKECPVAYTSAIALRRHEQRHTDMQFVCDVCGRAFKVKNTLKVHMNTHLPQRRFPCDRCERRFAQKSALAHHMNRDHLNIPPPFACAVCPKRFPRMSNLKSHMKAKHGLTPLSRQMFFKALPTMKETDLKQATVVFNSTDNQVITAPLRESILNKYGELVTEDDISIPSDEDSDVELVQSESDAAKPTDVQVVTEIVPIGDGRVKLQILGKNERLVVNEDEVFGTTNVTVNVEENYQEHVDNEQKDIPDTPYDQGLVKNDQEGIPSTPYEKDIGNPYDQGLENNQEEEILGNLYDKDIGTPYDQGLAKHDQEEILGTPYNQRPVKEEQKEMLGTPNNQGHVKKGQKEILGTPKNVFQTTLQGNCELEFVKFIAQRGECSKDKTRTDSKTSKLGSCTTKMNKNIQVNTFRGSDIPVLKSNFKPEAKITILNENVIEINTNYTENAPDITNKTIVTNVTNKSASEIKILNRKRVNEGSPRTKINIFRTPIRSTRSSDKKPRNSAIVKQRVPIKNRNNSLKKNR